MKEAVIMTREEYKGFYDSFQELKEQLHRSEDRACMLNVDLICALQRIQHLRDLLNRPAVEALQAKHNKEYYSWCEEIASKYEQLDEEEWLKSRARFYNNRVYDFCKENGISEEEAYSHRQYYDGIKFWSDSAVSSGLMAECDDMDIDVYKTEGWSDLPYRHIRDWSGILSKAQDDAWNRYQQHKHETGPSDGKYWHLWRTFMLMREESECLGNGCHEFYR